MKRKRTYEDYKITTTGMRLITLYLPEVYINALDRLVGQNYYPHRAEAIRMAVHDFLDVEVGLKKVKENE